MCGSDGFKPEALKEVIWSGLRGPSEGAVSIGACIHIRCPEKFT